MKKLVAFVLATMVVLSLGAGVIAESADEPFTADGDASKDVELAYTISENVYVISMPSTVNFTSTEKTFYITLTEAHSDNGINCSINSGDTFALVKGNDVMNSITYTLDSYNFTLTNSNPTKSVTITIPYANIKTQAAGTYKDTLTFSFSPVSAVS